MAHTDWPYEAGLDQYPDRYEVAGAWPYFHEYPATDEFQGELRWLSTDSGPLLSDTDLKAWECPKCGAVYAPSEKECWRCNFPPIVFV